MLTGKEILSSRPWQQARAAVREDLLERFAMTPPSDVAQLQELAYFLRALDIIEGSIANQLGG